MTHSLSSRAALFAVMTARASSSPASFGCSPREMALITIVDDPAGPLGGPERPPARRRQSPTWHPASCCAAAAAQWQMRRGADLSLVVSGMLLMASGALCALMAKVDG